MANSSFSKGSDHSENYTERQRDEVEALQSIYAADFIDVRSEKSNQPAMFEITLGPRRGASKKEVYAKVVLSIQFKPDYPKSVPIINVKNDKGLSSEEINALKNKLQKNAEKFVGEEMVHKLIYFIQDDLENYNFETPSSFYDEMLKNQKIQEAAKATDAKKKKDIILMQEQKKNKKIEEEAKRRRLVIHKKQHLIYNDDADPYLNSEHVTLSELPDGNPSNLHRESNTSAANHCSIEGDASQSSIDFDLMILQKSKTSRIAIDFEILTNLGQGAFGYVIKVKNILDDKIYAIKIIALKRNSKLLKSITNEVKVLSRLNHENIVRYYNSWIEEDYSSQDEIRSQHDFEEESSYSSYSHSQFIYFPHSDDDDDYDDDGKYDDEDYDDDDGKDDEEDLQIDGMVQEKLDSKKRYLCIQMEYCEKSTLKTCVEKNLYKDVVRVWRLFREILDALAHIHDQGIIHRDLKPGNIFLDSQDHIKIGDFGLATSRKPKLQQTVNLSDLNQETYQNESCSMNRLTTDIGTAYYMSPEMSSTSSHYDQRIDMYSLGIVFFEMCYRMETGMERHIVLTNLRKEKIIFPDNFSGEFTNQKLIIEDLLIHKPECRPTSKQLLKSGLLPPVEIEEAKVHDILSSAIANSQSKTYKHAVESFFNQKYDEVCDIMFDDEVSKPCNVRYVLLQQNVIEIMSKIFSQHGAIRIATPLLMPKNKIHLDTNPTFMDQNGQLVCLPDNHKVPLIRYVKRKNIYELKRYNIERVFTGKPYGLQPKEFVECSFDIITPTSNNLLPDSEIIYLIEEIINEFNGLRTGNFTIVMNHTSILKGLLLYYGVSNNKLEEILHLIETQGEKTKYIQEALEKLDIITEHETSSLIKMLKLEGKLEEIQKSLHFMTKCKGEVQRNVKQGFKELMEILKYCNILEIKLPIKIKLGFLRDINHYSGMFFEVHSSNKRMPDILAAGGRFNKLMSDYAVPLYTKRITPTSPPCAVGVSISLDLIVSILNREKEEVVKRCDFMVCTHPDKYSPETLLKTAQSLWKKKKSTTLVYDNIQSLDKIEKQCKSEGIGTAFIIKDQQEVTEMIIEDTKWKKKTTKVDYSEQFCEMETKSRIQGPSFVMNFLLEKNSNKRTLEIQISKVLNSNLKWIPSNSPEVNVLVVDFPVTTIKDIAARIDITNENVFNESIDNIFGMLKCKRKILQELFDKIRDIRFVKGLYNIILYTIKGTFFKII